MKVVMLNPPFLNKYSKSSRSPAVTKSATVYFPLWLAYATGVLDKYGHEVEIIDAPARCLDEKQTMELIDKFGPQFVVIDTSTGSIESDLAFAAKIKKSYPNVTICVVGTHASACFEEILKENVAVDYVARHEYDYTLPELIECIEGKRDKSTVLGVSYLENGEVKSTNDRPYIENLDELPFVAEVYKKHLNIEDYFYAHVSFPTVSVFSSRGCPSKCFYCMYSQVMFGKAYRKRSAKSLYEECKYITENFPNVKEILIDDDNFAVDQKIVKEFCKLMIDNHIQLKWVVQCRVTLEYETMVLMRKAGCRLIVVGYESGSQKVLDGMQKGITLEMSRKFNANAKKARLRVHGCFMVGNPGETKQTMEETLKFAKSLTMDTVQFFPLMVYPGTKAYDWAKENNYIKAERYRDWLLEDGSHNCVISTPEVSSEELVAFCNYARKKFYLRPKYVFYKGIQCITHKEDFVRTWKAFKTFRKHLLKK